MIRRYCDCCGNEVTSQNYIDKEGERLTGEVRKQGGPVLLKVKVITAKDGDCNYGDFCKYCVLDAIYKNDDRPKTAAAG
jgi:hypothetical protein